MNTPQAFWSGFDSRPPAPVRSCNLPEFMWALELTEYFPTRKQALDFVEVMSNLDGVLEWRVLPAHNGYWWAGQVYFSDGNPLSILPDSKIRHANTPGIQPRAVSTTGFQVVYRRFIPPGFFTTLAWRRSNGEGNT